MEQLFPPLTEEARRLLDTLPALTDRALPLPGRFRAGLARNVAELSRLLTSGRGECRESYLGEGPFLSAYLRYFLPWNVYRLARLLPSLTLPLGSGAAVTDLGSGPLTFPIALWISRPDLRNIPLEFRCLDRAAPALEAGKKLFAALSGGGCPWKIKTIHASLGETIRFSRAGLVTAINLFNELFWKLPRTDHAGLAAFAEKQARLLSSLCLETGSVLTLEPGVPRCGEFLSLLREAFSVRGRFPQAPCVHVGPCPMPGASPSGTPSASRSSGPEAKWCHFVFDTAGAPASLLRLSEAALIPKERSTLSFLLTGPLSGAAMEEPSVNSAPKSAGALAARIISDAFPLGDTRSFGRYGCSCRGLALVSGKRGDMEGLKSGTLETFAVKIPEQRDKKSGALMAGLRGE
ncbi:MAG: rRNA methyltransferase [Treponema sp.]|jgi:hypothetical protein|nr:rRNA methyltransferase [Treponema sp.]